MSSTHSCEERTESVRASGCRTGSTQSRENQSVLQIEGSICSLQIEGSHGKLETGILQSTVEKMEASQTIQ